MFARTRSTRLKTVVTHLAMTERPQLQLGWEDPRITLTEDEAPDLLTYRGIYNDVGRCHHWVNRRYMPDYSLQRLLHDPLNRVFYLRRGVDIIGFTEINMRQAPEIELVFVGLIEAAQGMGLGKKLLHHTLDIIWAQHPQKVIIQTNTLDHPNALRLYQQTGFRPVSREEVTIIDRG